MFGRTLWVYDEIINRYHVSKSHNTPYARSKTTSSCEVEVIVTGLLWRAECFFPPYNTHSGIIRANNSLVTFNLLLVYVAFSQSIHSLFCHMWEQEYSFCGFTIIQVLPGSVYPVTNLMSCLLFDKSTFTFMPFASELFVFS